MKNTNMMVTKGLSVSGVHGSFNEPVEQPQHCQLDSTYSQLRWGPKSEADNQRCESDKLIIQQATLLESREIRWLYDNWLAEGELTLLTGAPGSGKTTLVCLISAGLSNEKKNNSKFNANGQGHVIFVSAEDDAATTLLPRLKAAGADLDFIHFISCSDGYKDESPFSFSSKRDIYRLIGLDAKLEHNIALIIVDPIYSAVRGDVNNNHNARVAYEDLTKLAKQLECGILGVSHSVKNPIKKAVLARIAGPSALREVPRIIIYLSKICNGPRESGATHVMVHAKNNIGIIEGGFECRLHEVGIDDQNIQRKATKFSIGEELFGSSEDILYEADRPKKIETTTKLEIAEQFLQKTLKDGSRLFIDISKLAQAAGISDGTLRNAKKNLQIVTKKQQGDGRSLWSMPICKSMKID